MCYHHHILYTNAYIKAQARGLFTRHSCAHTRVLRAHCQVNTLLEPRSPITITCVRVRPPRRYTHIHTRTHAFTYLTSSCVSVHEVLFNPRCLVTHIHLCTCGQIFSPFSKGLEQFWEHIDICSDVVICSKQFRINHSPNAKIKTQILQKIYSYCFLYHNHSESPAFKIGRLIGGYSVFKCI